jgi:hypothetical protein
LTLDISIIACVLDVDPDGGWAGKVWNR